MSGEPTPPSRTVKWGDRGAVRALLVELEGELRFTEGRIERLKERITDEESTEAEVRFRQFVTRLLGVPKHEILIKEKEWKRERELARKG